MPTLNGVTQKLTDSQLVDIFGGCTPANRAITKDMIGLQVKRVDLRIGAKLGTVEVSTDYTYINETGRFGIRQDQIMVSGYATNESEFFNRMTSAERERLVKGALNTFPMFDFRMSFYVTDDWADGPINDFITYACDKVQAKLERELDDHKKRLAKFSETRVNNA